MDTPRAPVQATAELDDAFRERLLERHARQPKKVLLPVSLTALAIGGLAATAAPLIEVAAWLTLVGAVLILRVVVVGRLDQARGRSASKRLQIAVVLMAVSGVVHALSLFFFPYLPQFERALHSMLLVGMSAGCIATASGYPPIFRAYTIATLGPLAVVWAVTPGPDGAAWVQTLMAIIMVLFALSFDLLARDTFGLFRESYDYRLELASALEDVQRASRAKTRFLASASHDLRQPMTTLSLFATALSMRPLDDRTRQIANNINDALRDLTVELDALLDISKLDAGVVRAEPATCPVGALLSRIVSVHGPQAEQKHLKLDVTYPDSLVIHVDRTLLDRVLRNLVDNAIKYTDAGEVRVSARADGRHCLISVVDTGRGIPEMERERVFEEFYQLDNPERDRSRGLGLGLAIVRRLVALMGITLRLSSTPGTGSTFELEVPLAQAALPACADEPVLATTLAGLVLLIVDDEERVRLGMQAMLESFGCRTLLAAGTADAVELAKAHRPDLLIADFRLRGTDDGLVTIKSVRELHPDLPAVLVSGDTAPDRLREVEHAGVTMLHKPVASALLVEEIRRLTSNNKQREIHHGIDRGAIVADPLDLNGIRGARS